MRTLQQEFDKLEDIMNSNIANSLVQLHFHQHASVEELTQYYGWKNAVMSEEERAAIVDDTARRIESEQIILNFYEKHKEELQKTYGEKNATGNLNLPEKRAIGEGSESGSISPYVGGDVEGGSGQSADGDAGLGVAHTETDNSAHETQGDEGGPDARPDATPEAR